MVKQTGVDKWLFFVTLVLVVFGLAMVFSASAIVARESNMSEFVFAGRQAGWALAGVLAMLGLMCVDVSSYKSPRVVYPAVAITVLLLLGTYLLPNSRATHRWIRFGHQFTFQPSELAKLVLVLFMAWFLHTRLDKMRDWKGTLLRVAIVPVMLIGIVGKQPDLGTALVLAGVTAMMLILAGIEWKWLLGAFLLSLPPLILMLMVGFRQNRLKVFLHPEADPTGPGFHIYQSLIAVGAGGLTGRGYMEGIQKLFFLPEAATDFIYANICEELGLMGALGLLALFGVFAWRGLRTAFRSQDPFARFMAFGITTTILLQAFFNISVVLSLVPAKGIPLPLISSGGTSLFTTLASIGILLSISRKTE
jgi:cell division protein FtsW